MIATLRSSMLWTLGALMFLAPPMAARANTSPGTDCAAGMGSAIVQYCENIPSATGARQAAPNTVALGGVLPHQTVSQLLRGGTRHFDRRLLQLPAPGPHVPLAGALGAATAGGWSVFSALMVILAILGAGLAGGTLAQRWRREAA